MQVEKRLEFLIPDRFFVAMTRVAQRHPKDPRPSPLARGRVERRRAAEEIHLRFGPRRTVKDADGPEGRRDRPREAFSPMPSMSRIRVVRWGTAKAPSGAESISFRGHAGRELFGPVERHLDLKRRTVRLQHQEVLAIGHHGKT